MWVCIFKLNETELRRSRQSSRSVITIHLKNYVDGLSASLAVSIATSPSVGLAPWKYEIGTVHILLIVKLSTDR